MAPPSNKQACADDKKRFCAQIHFGGGAVRKCLLKKVHELGNPNCTELLSAHESDAMEDIRLSPELQSLCRRETLLFCSHLRPGNGRVLHCLSEHKKSTERTGFSTNCRQGLHAFLQHHLSDISLHGRVKRLCRNDVRTLCAGVQAGKGRVLDCLQQHDVDIKDKKCQAEVSRLIELLAEDGSLDARLNSQCRVELDHFCSKTASGHGRLRICLGAHRAQLSPVCEQNLYNHDMLSATSVRYLVGGHVRMHTSSQAGQLTPMHCQS